MYNSLLTLHVHNIIHVQYLYISIFLITEQLVKKIINSERIKMEFEKKDIGFLFIIHEQIFRMQELQECNMIFFVLKKETSICL